MNDEFEPTADEAPVPPQPPADEECCGSGCDPCVWDTYQAQVREYRTKLLAWQQRQAAKGSS